MWGTGERELQITNQPKVASDWGDRRQAWRRHGRSECCAGGKGVLGGVGCSILDTCLQEPLGGSGPCAAGGSRRPGARMRSPALLPKDTWEGRGVQEPHRHLWQREQEFAGKLEQHSKTTCDLRCHMVGASLPASHSPSRVPPLLLQQNVWGGTVFQAPCWAIEDTRDPGMSKEELSGPHRAWKPQDVRVRGRT